MSDSPHPCSRAGCGLDRTRKILAGEFPGSGDPFEFRRCELCDMGFVSPWPSAAQVASLYSADYTYYAEEDGEAKREARSLKFQLGAMRHRYLVRPGAFSRVEAVLAASVELAARKTFTYSLGIPLALPRAASMLDYGCGTGRWLIAMRERGYTHLAGFDIAANTRFRDRLGAAGVEVFNQTELDLQPPGTFSLIRLEHVLEHLQSPARTLRRVRELLAPGGWLVLTIPSILPWRDFPNLAESPHRPHLQLPMHLMHHSRASLVRLVEEAGLRVQGVRVTQRERFLTLVARAETGGAR